jgi:hypothetical protein
MNIHSSGPSRGSTPTPQCTYQSFKNLSEFQANQKKSTFITQWENLSKRASSIGNSIKNLNPLRTSFIAYLSSFDLSKNTAAFAKVSNGIFSSIFNRSSSNPRSDYDAVKNDRTPNNIPSQSTKIDDTGGSIL